MLIIADDLTGAADVAGAFVAAGHRVVVRLDGEAAGEDAITVVDTDSRAMSEVEAFLATAEVVLHSTTRPIYLKVDSTWRGHGRAYVDGVLSALDEPPARVVVCPAFPARGRTVRDGTVHVDGEALEAGDLRAAFAGFSGAPLFIPTARTDADLALLARSMEPDVLWVGSAGLARHVAALTAPVGGGGDGDELSPVAHAAAGRICVVVGSQHLVVERQVGALDPGVQVFRIDPRDRAFVEQVLPVLTKCDGLVLTGGHTARVVLDALGVTAIRIGGEVEVGVPWGVIDLDGRRVAVVTKAGGFGDEQTLTHAVDFLRTEP